MHSLQHQLTACYTVTSSTVAYISDDYDDIDTWHLLCLRLSYSRNTARDEESEDVQGEIISHTNLYLTVSIQQALRSSPPLDNIRVMVIVWRLRGNIIRTALCWVVWHNVHSLQHTHMSSSYRSSRLGLSHWDPYAMRSTGGCLEGATENAGRENAAPDCRVGKRGTGKCRSLKSMESEDFKNLFLTVLTELIVWKQTRTLLLHKGGL